MILPCLSLWQPWASFLVWGVKGPETRGWKAPAKYMGQPMLIHAAKRPLPAYDEIPDDGTHRALLKAGRKLSDLRFGCILGVGTLTGCYRTDLVGTAEPEEFEEAKSVLVPLGGYPITPLQNLLGNYADGRFAWVFEDCRELQNPVEYRGQQGIFMVDVPDPVAASLGLLPCLQCGGSMKPGQALKEGVSGSPDFIGGDSVVTLSPSGQCSLVACMKCEDCGWSVSA